MFGCNHKRDFAHFSEQHTGILKVIGILVEGNSRACELLGELRKAIEQQQEATEERLRKLERRR